jgi:hypothetical protein
MQGDVDLTTGVLEAFRKAGVMDRADASQVRQRHEIAWRYMFKDTVPFKDPAAIERESKSNVEAIWANFLPTYQSYFLVVTPEYIRRDRPRYILGAYYRALVTSGVAAKMLEVSKQELYAFKGDYLVYQGTNYQFPGGVTVLQTPGRPRDLFFWDTTFDVPDSGTRTNHGGRSPAPRPNCRQAGRQRAARGRRGTDSDPRPLTATRRQQMYRTPIASAAHGRTPIERPHPTTDSHVSPKTRERI